MVLLGAVKSPIDERDWKVAQVLAPEPVAIPIGYRLTSVVSMPPVYEQVLPSCVTSSISGMAEWHERSESGTSVRLNDEKFYWRCKELDGIPNVEGTFSRVGLDIWKNEGIYADNGKGPGHFKIKAYYSVPVTAQDIAQVIYQKKQPVALIIAWPNAWVGMPSTGIAPKLSENPSILGGHQGWIWGYDFTRADHGLLFRNSWGKYWGLNGSFWMGEQWLTRNLGWEAWYGESQP